MNPLPDIGWKTGFEIELMAPEGLSRATLAAHIAEHVGGTVHPFWHAQSEPSKVPGMPVFHNLTQGFEVRDGNGWQARCVDDITLQQGLDRDRPARSGWFRIVSDDRRLLRLVQRHARPVGDIRASLEPVAALFGVTPRSTGSGMVRVADDTGASICLGAPLPGQRERPTELVTAPIEANHHHALGRLLDVASRSGFVVAHEAAVHVHCDGARLRSPLALQRLVRLWLTLSAPVRARVGTNPACMRLGDWSTSFVTAALSPDARGVSWAEHQRALRGTELTKYCDLNVSNLILDVADKPTVEFRIFPGSMSPRRIVAFGHIAAAICRAAVTDTPVRTLEDLPGLPHAVLDELEP